MPDIQSSDPGRKLQDRYDITGAPTAFSVSEEIIPVALVDDLTAQSAFAREFERACSVNDRQGASIGNISIIALVNPPNSGVLCIVDDVRFNYVAANISVGIRQLGNNPAVLGFFTDSRVTGRAVCGSVPSVAAAQPAEQYRLDVPLGGPELYPLGHVLLPARELFLAGSAINTALSAAIRWRERVLLPSEA